MSDPAISIYMATNCYGGMAQAAFMRALMAFRAECVERRVQLHIGLSGGEALSSRGRAVQMAKFLASGATHLVFTESDRTFDAEAVFGLVASDQPVAEGDPGSGLFVIACDAAQRMTDGYPQLKGSVGDMQGLQVAQASFVFDNLTDPTTHRYLSDLDAFCSRWRSLAGN